MAPAHAWTILLVVSSRVALRKKVWPLREEAAPNPNRNVLGLVSEYIDRHTLGLCTKALVHKALDVHFELSSKVLEHC